MDLQIIRSDANTVHAERPLETGEPVLFMAQEMRYEKTGMHAEIGLMFRQKVLNTHVMNLARVDSRAALIREAWPLFEEAGEVTIAAYPKTSMSHDLTQFCFWLRHDWENTLAEVVTYDHTDGPPKGKEFALDPYLLDNSGTIAFAPPESGKSMIAQAMAICIASDIAHIWPVTERPVLYINLERPPGALERRDHALLGAMGIPSNNSRVSYLHMRGKPLPNVLRKAGPFLKANPKAVVILDSISRTRLGSLIEDQVAMQFVDMMGELGVTWLGIGHTPRSTSDHLFGSIHYDAGADIMLKFSSEPNEDRTSIGVLVEMTKANDIKRAPAGYYALDFTENGLSNIRASSKTEFPKLYVDSRKSPVQRIRDMIDANHGEVWQHNLASGLEMDQGLVSRYLNDTTNGFFKIRSEGRQNLWGILTKSK